MRYWKHYHLPERLGEALDLLASYRGEATLIAGGTDLLLDLDEGRHPPVEALIDVTRIAEMKGIRKEDEVVHLGAAVTHSEIVASALLQEQAACLVESCRVIGGPQVRNVATIGGNVAHALPAADGTVSLVALGTEALVARRGEDGSVSQTWRPLLELFLGPGQSAVDRRREIIVAFRFPARRPFEGSAFDRIMRPQGIALPILGVAARVQVTPDGERFQRVSLCIAPAGPVPFRASEAERVLEGAVVSEGIVERAIRTAQEEAHVRTSRHRATKAYRQEMIAVLVRRVLSRALERALSHDRARAAG